MVTPAPGSADELQRFSALQATLAGQFARLYPDPLAPRTVVVVPSLTLDQRELAKITGAHHYEERQLCMLMLLRLPRTRVVFVTAEPIDAHIVDYYLHLLAGIPSAHARRRLTLLACQDASNQPLTAKVLARPRLLRRIRDAIDDPASAHLSVFNCTPLERTLAVRLGIPVFAPDPALAHLGTKSGSREIFEAAGIPAPPGHRGLRDRSDMLEALAALRADHPQLEQAVVKLDRGFSGEGNALLPLDGAPAGGAELEGWLAREVPERLSYEADDERWEHFAAKFDEMGGIVEAFVDGEDKRSPSMQGRVMPDGSTEIVSTHDQVLGGRGGQVFLGATFPADAEYRLAIQASGEKVGQELAARGVIGRFGVDFVSVRDGAGGWRHRAIEINLRKGGTTHPFMMLQFLTEGRFDPDTGLFVTAGGEPRFYYASDNLEREAYRGLMPEDLIDVTVIHGLHFHGPTQRGVTFHLIGALSEFGKLGLVCIGDSPEVAAELHARTVQVLDAETRPAT